MQPGEPWPLPELDTADRESSGPVLVTVDWSVRADQTETFLELAGRLRGLRRRTGATSWRLYRPAGNEREFLETFVVSSWAEHERQHARIYPPTKPSSINSTPPSNPAIPGRSGTTWRSPLDPGKQERKPRSH